ncbi:MAG: peptide chain release factor 1 [Dehalococcoidia bacterium]|nr:peptide chain release factor 1 [Dehalococcoidia bacterium]
MDDIKQFLPKLESVERRYNDIERQMADAALATDYGRVQTLAKERASIEDVVNQFRSYRKVDQELQDTLALVKESGDEEMRAMARQEADALEKRRNGLIEELHRGLLPRDPNDEKDVIVEVRAGAGGDEAALFASDLFRMYSRYAQRHNWKTEVINTSAIGIGGFKEITFEVHGKGAYSRLKHESGVHRVQRVPSTESSGRIHTSTATVAVLPEIDEVDVQVNPDELRIDIFHASGHGGQNVQKVATAVRIVHVPTGIVASCQDERSQLKNKTKAMALLRARLYEIKRRKQEEQVSQQRRAQVGTAERSEKGRTYNFPQNRVTDHRVNITVHNLEGVLDGDLDKLIDALQADEQERKLAESLV